ncbi:MAG: hypothetical protein P4L31_08565 [Candidatus Babeliales bacterium]|nr:hypothetical protein [Candidatus Babeliales bacterium]
MNTIKKMSFLLFLTIITCICDAQQITGQLAHTVEDNNRIDHKTIPFYSDKHSYVKGGITFLYPDGYFTSEPHVYVTLELNGLRYSPDLQLSPIIVKSTLNTITIYVNKETDSLFSKTSSEAATDDVIVHVFIFGS